MKKTIAIIASILIFSASLALAAGDKNQNRHDGSKGKGTTTQERVRSCK